MCTVSFVYSNNKIIITSNRDENVMRPNAIPPESYSLKGKNVFFPKDPKAGGTWFVVDENGTVLILLNGASEKHKVEPHYRKSRGLIVLDLIAAPSPKDYWQEIVLKNIEPFTLVLFENQELFQMRWNGIHKEISVLDSKKNYIWSSSTLYSNEVRTKRSGWFYDFLEGNAAIDNNEMLKFHQYTEEENQQNGLVINRNEELKTVSITQSVIEKNKVTLLHYDLMTSEKFVASFERV